MSLKTYVLWTFLLPISLAHYPKWQINREYGARDSPRYNALNCTTIFTTEIIQLIIDYALWRNVAMLYIVDESIHSGCNMKTIRQNLNCFNSNGLSISLQRKFHKMLNPVTESNLVLVVSFIKPGVDFQRYLDQINLFSQWDKYSKWLNIYPEIINSTTEKSVLDILRCSALTVSADVAVAVTTANFTKNDKILHREGCKSPLSSAKELENTHVEILLPFNRIVGKNDTLNVTFTSLCGPYKELHQPYLCILQLYKISKSSNKSLVIRPLGHWSYGTGTAKLKPFQSVETRINFQGFSLIFGKKQFKQEANVVADESVIEDDNDEENMDKISEYLSIFLNATQKVKMYPTLGLKGPSGNWTGLLGAVVAQEVDLGLDSVIKVPERYNDMVFTHNIMTSIRNIYLKPELSHSARDIFLTPFQPRLIMSVLGTGIISALVMACYIISGLIQSDQRPVFVTYIFAISDALLWILGIFSMQGTLIQPRSYSGNIIVVILLVFALIIYNSYSAFITSMLSVKLYQIKTLGDLLQSDYDIGYTKNSQDEIFLRSMNESQLNQIYLRGYLHNNITTVTDGLLKAAKGNYGFFATGHVARKQILKISSYKCTNDIMEIEVASTKNTIAFPMSSSSPYRKAINMCLIKMTETGVHDYITSQIAPKLTACQQQNSYQSARLNDLITSFGLLGIGLVTGCVTVLFECFWKKRRVIYSKLRGTNKWAADNNLEFVH